MNKTDKKALLPYNLYSGGAITWKLSEICNVADTVNAQKKRGVQDATGSTDFFFPASLHSKKTSSNATASSFIIVTSSNVCLHLPWTFLFFLKDFIYLFIFLRCFIYLFSETGKGRRKGGEKQQRVVASRAPPTGHLARTPGLCPDWELNGDTRWTFLNSTTVNF